MADPFIGEIKMFAGNFAPRNYSLCQGQLLPIAQNTALFSLLGTTYGGDGRTTFGLPDLQGRIPVHPGSGPGLTPRTWGQKAGTETETITTSTMPSHNHAAGASSGAGTTDVPAANVFATGDHNVYGSGTPAAMNGGIVGDAGGNQSHNNLAPYLCINFIIVLTGIFPSRN